MLLLLVSATSAHAQTTLVPTSSGTVAGFVAGSGTTEVTRWLGIPYAEPPVGSLRWKRPVPKTASPTTIDATAPKAACMQTIPQFSALECRDFVGQGPGTLVGSEDCLTLSVLRPTPDLVTPRPVMVWVHGGAFVSGCVKDGLTEGSDLALHGTEGGQVVVEIQYRLGPMGFFALPELAAEDPDGSAGNYGMLDMVLALEWVQDNIAAFGGDPANVTIFGESAGGLATCALLASPLTENLFERAISESGNCGQAIPLQAGAGATFSPTTTAIGRGLTLASNAAIGCTDPVTRAACMRGKTPAQIYPVYNQAIGGLGFPPTNMVLDNYFLDEQPAALLAQGAGFGRSFLVGSNANEMNVFTLSLSVPNAAVYEFLVRTQFGNYVADLLLPIWPASEFPTPLAAYRRLSEDTFFVCPAFAAAKSVSDSGADAFAYHYAYVPSTALGPSTLGAFHGLELFHLFGTYARLAALSLIYDEGDTLFSDAIQDAWTSFARTGAPLSTPAWPFFDTAPSGLASAGSALVWDLAPENTLANSVQTVGALRDGRCAELEALVPVLNADQDGRTNDVDNCPFVANSDQANPDLDPFGSACDVCPFAVDPGQSDLGGVAGAGPDGVGDACQCGDADDDTDVDDDDVTALREALAAVASLTPGGTAKCSVAGGNTTCDVLDVAVLTRRLGAVLNPFAPSSCAAANPS